ncbi:hypothetical protein MSPP1_000682 [Malassezia sp. CBS 17886]|nr:hypothetical protein MSPP1_000682 [Malassezia sp. CBS 17886]
MLGSNVDMDAEWEEMPIQHVSRHEAELVDVDGSDTDEEDASSPHRVASRRARVLQARRLHTQGQGTNVLGGTSNVVGAHLGVHDARGFDWRAKPGEVDDKPHDRRSAGAEGYTQLRLDEDEEEEELHAATEYLFQESVSRTDDDPSAAPISQLAMTKRLLDEAQKIAYVGMCGITANQILDDARGFQRKDSTAASSSAHEWLVRVMVRLYQHLDIDPREQTMIDSLAVHGILPSDLARSLITTHTIENPAYQPDTAGSDWAEISERAPPAGASAGAPAAPAMAERDAPSAAGAPATAVPPTSGGTTALDRADEPPAAPYARAEEAPPSPPTSPTAAPAGAPWSPAGSGAPASPAQHTPVIDPNTAAQIAEREAHPDTSTSERTMAHTELDGVTTTISPSLRTITLDIRWTVLCDLFLVLTADSVYDARSRVLLERVAEALGLGWMDVTKFEKRITDALELEEEIETLEDKSVPAAREQAAKKKRMVMMGLATVGGGLVIGLSAGMLAPVIGAGIGAALGAMGIGGTSAFLGGVGGATVITTTGTIAGSTLGGRGMSRRMRSVKTFEFRPLHYHKRVNCIVTVPGFLKGLEDDPTLPYSVIDSVMGDVFSVMWEPEMMRDMGNAMSILWNETLVQGVQQVLAATVAGAMFSALAWPLWLTKLGYLIDNPWSNALERSRAAGLILADVLVRRQLGVRPITLVGFSLGARMIFFALKELARKKAYGVVQNVYLLGAPVSVSESDWRDVRSVVAGRFVNAFSSTDWILAYLHRAASGGLHSIAGLHPIAYDCGFENVDVTHLVPGHLAYRALTPLVLSEIGFKTTADYFDEPESLDSVPEREVVFEAPDEPFTPDKKAWAFWKRPGSPSKMRGKTRVPEQDVARDPAAYEKGVGESGEYVCAPSDEVCTPRISESAVRSGGADYMRGDDRGVDAARRPSTEGEGRARAPAAPAAEPHTGDEPATGQGAVRCGGGRARHVDEASAPPETMIGSPVAGDACEAGGTGKEGDMRSGNEADARHPASGTATPHSQEATQSTTASAAQTPPMPPTYTNYGISSAAAGELATRFDAMSTQGSIDTSAQTPAPPPPADAEWNGAERRSAPARPDAKEAVDGSRLPDWAAANPWD